MAENNPPERRRGPGRPFRKGQSGNPGGRPKAVRELLERVRCAVPAALDLAERLVVDEKQDAKVRLNAAKFLTAYGLGAPPRELPLVDDFSAMMDEELNRRFEQLRFQIPRVGGEPSPSLLKNSRPKSSARRKAIEAEHVIPRW